jgi:predicted CoA-substrate-specific enzyme activase
MFFAGVDIGSTMTKVIIIDEDEEITAYVFGPTGAEHRRLANKVMEEALKQAGLNLQDITSIIATGYGRVNVPFADKQVTEITCHARGIRNLFPEARTVIDIGGQDCKAIRIENGKVINFVMNEKCAAGTGRFLEIIAETLGVKVWELGSLSLKAKEGVEVSNICTLFAQQEIMTYLAEGVSIEAIVAGLFEGLAKRIGNMAIRVGIAKEVVVTGGGAKSEGLIQKIEEKLGEKILVPFEPLLSGALGAALIGKDRIKQALEKGEPLPSKERHLEEAILFA